MIGATIAARDHPI